MKKLRTLHLYLGCIFAPLLLFFALSGIWQLCGVHSQIFETLSTIHTAKYLKNGTGLSSPLLKVFVLLMAASFILTTILGVVMALKFGTNRRTAIYCLAVGTAVPLAAILIAAFR